MDISNLIEEEKLKKEKQADDRLKEKLRRQIAIFNQEKTSFTRKTQYDINKQKRALDVLDHEKDVEVENYLAMKSRAQELKFKKQETVVKELVKTTDTVKELLKQEIQDTEDLDKKVDDLNKQIMDHKRTTIKMKVEHDKYRMPCPRKMDSRVEWSSQKYHEQLVRNRDLETKIDTVAYIREVYMKQEKKMEADIQEVVNEINKVLSDTSDIYERRDRAESTKLKVKDHLNKVKDQFERELLSISLALSEDKKMENFMRTKHKDITSYLREQRERDIDAVEMMVRRKDEFTKAFDEIKAATGKDDMNVIIHDFIEAEEGNFAIFKQIGELLDENEELRSEIRKITDDNVIMEEKQLVVGGKQIEDIKASGRRIADYNDKSDMCMTRKKENSDVLTQYMKDIGVVLEILKIDEKSQPEFYDKKGKLRESQILSIMAVIEQDVSIILKDFAMVELATRATKFNSLSLTDDEVMLTRVPSARIFPRAVKVKVEKEAEEQPSRHTSSIGAKHTAYENSCIRSMALDRVPYPVVVSLGEEVIAPMMSTITFPSIDVKGTSNPAVEDPLPKDSIPRPLLRDELRDVIIDQLVMISQREEDKESQKSAGSKRTGGVQGYNASNETKPDEPNPNADSTAQ